MIEVKLIPVLNDNYVYLIHDVTTKKLACVDPAVFKPVHEAIQNCGGNLHYILNTHHHSDHVGANLEIKEKYNCQIVGNKNDKDRIPGIDITLEEGDIFSFGSSRSLIIDLPGHTVGHIAFYFKEDDTLFCGDTLFSLGCGRLFEGSPKQMVDSLEKIRNLPDNTKIFCGHEYTYNNAKFVQSLEPDNENIKKRIKEIKKILKSGKPTIPFFLSEEKKLNPFLRFDDKSFVKKIGLVGLSDEDNFKGIRKMKDQF